MKYWLKIEFGVVRQSTGTSIHFEELFVTGESREQFQENFLKVLNQQFAIRDKEFYGWELCSTSKASPLATELISELYG